MAPSPPSVGRARSAVTERQIQAQVRSYLRRRGMNQGDPAWDCMMRSQHIRTLARQEAERMDSASIRVLGVGSFPSMPDGGGR